MWNQEEVRQAATRTAPPADAGVSGPRKTADGNGVRAPHLGRSVIVKGEITGSEDLSVDGQVEGRIELPDHLLTVGPNALVRADITAREAVIFGTVVGNVTAREKLDVRRGGSVEGTLSCATLAVQDGAYLRGKVDTRNARASSQKPGSTAARALAPVA